MYWGTTAEQPHIIIRSRSVFFPTIHDITEVGSVRNKMKRKKSSGKYTDLRVFVHCEWMWHQQLAFHSLNKFCCPFFLSLAQTFCSANVLNFILKYNKRKKESEKQDLVKIFALYANNANSNVQLQIIHNTFNSKNS